MFGPRGSCQGGKCHSPRALCACLCTHVVHTFPVITSIAWSVILSGVCVECNTHRERGLLPSSFNSAPLKDGWCSQLYTCACRFLGTLPTCCIRILSLLHPLYLGRWCEVCGFITIKYPPRTHSPDYVCREEASATVVDFAKDSQHLVQYRLIADHLKSGSVMLL